MSSNFMLQNYHHHALTCVLFLSLFFAFMCLLCRWFLTTMVRYTSCLNLFSLFFFIFQFPSLIFPYCFLMFSLFFFFLLLCYNYCHAIHVIYMEGGIWDIDFFMPASIWFINGRQLCENLVGNGNY